VTNLQSIILGIVEGITEFLPISSTAHLRLTEYWLNIPVTEAVGSFTIAVQCGALLAAIVLYIPILLRSKRIWLVTLAAFLPTAIISFGLHSFVKHVLLENIPTLLIAMGLGGVLLILFEYAIAKKPSAHAQSLESMTIRQAMIIGICQSLAIVPGVSRSAATIVSGQLLGVSRRAIVEFSFLLAIPTLGAATALDLWKSRDVLSASDFGMILHGSAVAFVTAWCVMKWLLKYIEKHSFIGFGVYRIIVALGMGLYLFVTK
jgi:undecaprenyl-diphosphatase